jgi:hypothetical protein
MNRGDEKKRGSDTNWIATLTRIETEIETQETKISRLIEQRDFTVHHTSQSLYHLSIVESSEQPGLVSFICLFFACLLGYSQAGIQQRINQERKNHEDALPGRRQAVSDAIPRDLSSYPSLAQKILTKIKELCKDASTNDELKNYITALKTTNDLHNNIQADMQAYKDLANKMPGNGYLSRMFCCFWQPEPGLREVMLQFAGTVDQRNAQRPQPGAHIHAAIIR